MRSWPRLLLDLTLWHEWHAGRGSLPDPWSTRDLSGVYRSLGLAVWAPRRPWRVDLPGIEVQDRRGVSERVVTWGTPRGTLTSRWTLGPDGDWWQTEYPVKSREDVEVARLVAEARRYAISADREQSIPRADPEEIEVLELPQRPWSELFHVFLGWSEGLMLFLEEAEAILPMVEVLEEKLAALEAQIVGIPAGVALLPDNLDGQFIPPATFDERLAPSYARSVSTLHAAGKAVVVHVGGPVVRLLPGLAEAGIDCVEGVCGAPQGDSPLPEARAAAGSGLVLWGGIPQDVLLPSTSDEDFLAAVDEAFTYADRDPGVVVGVADKVPAEAVPERLLRLAEVGRSPR